MLKWNPFLLSHNISRSSCVLFNRHTYWWHSVYSASIVCIFLEKRKKSLKFISVRLCLIICVYCCRFVCLFFFFSSLNISWTLPSLFFYASSSTSIRSSFISRECVLKKIRINEDDNRRYKIVGTSKKETKMFWNKYKKKRTGGCWMVRSHCYIRVYSF